MRARRWRAVGGHDDRCATRVGVGPAVGDIEQTPAGDERSRVLGQLSKRVRVGLVDVGPHRHRDRCPIRRWHEGGIHDQEGPTGSAEQWTVPSQSFHDASYGQLPDAGCLADHVAALPRHDRPLRRRGSPQRGRCWTSPRCTRPEDLVALAPALASSWLASSCRAVDFEAYPILIGRCARGWDGAPHDIHSRPGRPVRPRSALRAQPAQDRAERDPPRQMWA
jgi:hypothetical protein